MKLNIAPLPEGAQQFAREASLLANLRITTEGLAVLVDFGIAREYDPLRKTTLGARATTPDPPLWS